ncbi:murein biosynthesis integral membrane protein MurJ [Corynebacterium anserum]|nr:murein biosynthesis integral membrane protein MurJ [Corynebacterium anserum]
MTTPHHQPDGSALSDAINAPDPTSGQRGRFRAARPPAIAPERKQRWATQANSIAAGTVGAGSGGGIDHSTLSESPSERLYLERALKAAEAEAASKNGQSTTGTKGAASNDGKASDEEMVRAGGSMAIATLISRITGFLRTVFIGSALGAPVASAFNTANTLPNLITELVLGAVLTALVVPVLVRAEKEDPDQGAAFIRRLLTVTFSLTIVVTLVSVLTAPLLVRASLDSDGQVNVGMSTAFAYLVLPQIVFYAMFAVFMAVLNTKSVFKPGAWAPVINNVVTLAVLSLYLFLPQSVTLHPSDDVTITNPSVLLLGLGTTAGVVVQVLIMVPYLKKAGIDLRPLWGIDARLKSFGGMAIAIVVYVAISQLGFILNNRIASQASDAAPTIYMQAWQFLQMPYGVIGVTLLTAVMPRLSRNAADGDDKAVVRDLTVASKLTMLAMIPIIVFFTAFGTLISAGLFNYANYTLETANILGWTISFSAFTLIPYALVLLHLRVFYAREEVWTPTFIIAGITTTKLLLAFAAPHIASEPRLVVVLLGAANGFGFLAGAIIGDRLLRRSLGDLQFRTVIKTSLWALGASLVGALVAWRVDVLLTQLVFTSQTNPWFLIRMMIAGVIFLAITGVVLSRSSLPEVLTVANALSRLPVIGGLFSQRQADTTPETPPATPQPSAHAVALEAASANTIMPVLPPLSAGRVRGPRLVPGAPVCNGQYRLLADHGGSSAARLWQAREMATGDVVALTIMDPAVMGGHRGRDEKGALHMRGGAAKAQAKQQILDRARALQGVNTPGMARIRSVIDGGTLVVVIADWVNGSALDAVAESGPDPLAAGYAVADLAEAVADAHDAGTPLGLDHRDRIRISTEGNAVMAFPGALPENNERQDAHGVAAALGLLLENVPYEEVPTELGEEYMQLRELSRQRDSELDLRNVAHTLRTLTTGELSIDEDSTPDPASQTGFGAERVKAKGLVTAGVIGLVSVALIAAVAVIAVTVFGGNREDSPLTTDSLRDGASAISQRTPVSVPVKKAEEWIPSDGRGTLDSPETAGRIIDGDLSSVWESDSYLQQLGPGPGSTKAGIGLMLTLPENTKISRIKLHGLRAGTTIELRSANGTPRTLSDTKRLGTITANGNDLTVALSGDSSHTDDSGQSQSEGAVTPSNSDSDANNGSNRLILWITALPQPAGAATISEVEVFGTWKGQPAAEKSTNTTQETIPGN